MRAIKFKAQRVDNLEWIYGYYVKDPSGFHRIYLQPFSDSTSNTYYFVIEDTIVQFTGLLDKYKKEIYEGDVIEHEGDHVCIIVFDSGAFKMKYIKGSETGITRYISYSAQFCRVVGNVFENQDLLI